MSPAAVLQANDLATITAAARLVLMGNGGSLADQLPRASSPASLPPGEFAARMSRRYRRTVTRLARKFALSERIRGLFRWWARVCYYGREVQIGIHDLTAGAVDKRPREPQLRLPDDRSRPWLYMVGQLSDEPAYTVVERPGFGSARRSRLPAGRRNWRNLDTHTPADWTFRPGVRPSRSGLYALRQSEPTSETGDDSLRSTSGYDQDHLPETQ